MKELFYQMDWGTVLATVWTVVIIPLIGYFKGKIDEWAKLNKIEKYTAMLYDSVENVVKDVQESIVDDIKGTPRWTPEKIEEIKQIAIDKAISSMTYEGYKILNESNADFEAWVDSIIRAKLYDLKH